MIDKAVVSHGQNGWTLHVEEVSLWRIWLSEALMGAMHAIGVCCGIRLFAWARRLPDRVAFPFYYATSWLLNWAGRIDNGWLHVRYSLPLDDDLVRASYPDFWADVASWADEEVAS